MHIYSSHTFYTQILLTMYLDIIIPTGVCNELVILFIEIGILWCDICRLIEVDWKFSNVVIVGVDSPVALQGSIWYEYVGGEVLETHDNDVSSMMNVWLLFDGGG